MAGDGKQSHIAILPHPGAGHLIPLVELAHRLLLLNPTLSFTFLLIPTADDSSSTTTPSALSSLPSTAFNIITLRPPPFPPFSNIFDENINRSFRSVNHSLPSLRQTLRHMTRDRHVSALIVDIFATDLLQVGSELGIKSYIFYSSSAIALSLFLHINELHKTTSSNEWDLNLPLKLPGCPVFQVKDTPEPIWDRDTVYYKWFLEHTERYKSADGIILNSFDALENGPIRALVEPGPESKPPVHLVGPLVRTGSSTDPSGCISWLDEQPPGSVLYVSFGSGGTLSTDQVRELAWGLELGQQRFLWVVRSPNDLYSFGAYLSLEEEHDPLGFLPEGFVERTRGRGLVVKSWAPQVDVLRHGSTGGFMTHCGWNSILEGAINGVGFVAWPLHAEQRMNAMELVEEVKVAVKVEKDEGGIVRRDEIAKKVKQLMEGEEGMGIKDRIKTLKEEAKRATDKDGSSYLNLLELALLWKTH